MASTAAGSGGGDKGGRVPSTEDSGPRDCVALLAARGLARRARQGQLVVQRGVRACGEGAGQHERCPVCPGPGAAGWGGHGIKVGCIPADPGEQSSAGSVFNKLQCRGYSKGGSFDRLGSDGVQRGLGGDGKMIWVGSAEDHVDLCPEATSEWSNEVEWDSSRTMPDGFYHGIYGKSYWGNIFNKLGCLVAITASHPLLSNVRASIESWRGDWRSYQNYWIPSQRYQVISNDHCYYDDYYSDNEGNACCPQHFKDDAQFGDGTVDAYTLYYDYRFANNRRREFMYRGVQFLNHQATGVECDIVWACEDLRKFTDTSVARGA